MKKLLIINCWLLVIGLLINSPTWGQSPTPTPDEKVQEIREAVKEMVTETRKGQKRAFVGEIIDITNTTLSLDTQQGEKQARAGEETTIIGLSKKEIEFEDLELGSFAIVMGYLEETGILDVRRIVIDKKPEAPAREVAFGEVIDASTEEKILTVKHPKKGTVYSVEATGTTTITKKGEEEKEKIKFGDIEIGDFLVTIGTPSEENENFITAKLIHIFLSQTLGQEEATPSPGSEE